ncbi:preprotein translocase subunit TatB [Anaerosporomusa subterranea]|uniref:Preprotein translocase subunit TatB n=1 Tax=Anaerosporomusa subterranea TaxID=1794912 RepID=A0A154BMG7_ANASB|nr:sulfurtransferase TusA family protein [Anaerosporomusa subterranea]KYZ75177.1 preprotein translocase subunit TatB [Anaerosporomusa subterranea]
MENTLDLRGLSCPIPLIKTKQAMEKADCVQVILDETTPKENILKYARSQSFQTECEEVAGEYRITIRKV